MNSFNEYGTSDHFSEPTSHPIENGIPADAIWDSDALEFLKEEDPQTQDLVYDTNGVAWNATIDVFTTPYPVQVPYYCDDWLIAFNNYNDHVANE